MKNHKTIWKTALAILAGSMGVMALRVWSAAPAPLSTQIITVKNHKIQLQLGKSPDAAGQRVTMAMVRALGKRMYGTTSPLQLKVIPGPRAAQGYFNEVYISGHPAKIRKMPITSLTLYARNVRVDVPHLMSEHKVQTLSAVTTLRAVVTEKDLTALLAQGGSTGSMGLKVKFLTGNRFRVTGNWNWTWFSGPIDGIARLRMAAGNKIDVDVLSLKLNGAEVPDFVKAKFAERLNPVLDYNDVPFQPRFKTLKVIGTQAIITA